MSGQKKGGRKTTDKIILATAIIHLISSLIDLIGKLIE